MLTIDGYFEQSNIYADDDFIGTVIDSPNSDVRKGWEKAKSEGKIKKSWFTMYVEGSRTRKVMHCVEHCLFLSGYRTTDLLMNELNLAKKEFAALQTAKELKAIRKEIASLKAELKPKKKKPNDVIDLDTHHCD